MVSYDARNGRCTRVLELWRNIVLDDRADLLGEKDFLRNMIPNSALLSE
jgi:hypothetical protein